MDKQKEIQKMQQEIFDSCAWRFSKHPEDYREVANDIGEDLYNLGYRNCKDKVVLTQEEYTNYIVEYMGVKEIKQRVSKETAMDIFQWLKEHTFDGSFAIIETYFKEQYGVNLHK